jgi:hypothetical protein
MRVTLRVHPDARATSDPEVETIARAGDDRIAKEKLREIHHLRLQLSYSPAWILARESACVAGEGNVRATCTCVAGTREYVGQSIRLQSLVVAPITLTDHESVMSSVTRDTEMLDVFTKMRSTSWEHAQIRRQA